MSLKLKKIIDGTKGTIMESLIGDREVFQQLVQNGLDKLQIMVVEYFTKEKVVERIHELNSPDDMISMFETFSMMPPDGLMKIAEYIDNHHSKEKEHIKVLLYMELGKQIVKGVQEYLNEQCRQRMQALARQQALIIKPGAGKIITP